MNNIHKVCRQLAFSRRDVTFLGALKESKKQQWKYSINEKALKCKNLGTTSLRGQEFWPGRIQQNSHVCIARPN